MPGIAEDTHALLEELGVDKEAYIRGDLDVRSPITGECIGSVQTIDFAAANQRIEQAHEAFEQWRMIPAPQRGELVQLLGQELRASKETLGRLVTIETGKILSEGLGEVQEMIDICTYAAGLSRQLHGLTIASERPRHHLIERWHPLGVVGVISAFNFPVAVWSWNAALAFVCGDAVVWKPSEKTPLTALAVASLFHRAAGRFGSVPQGLLTLLLGGRTVGDALVTHSKVPLVSATGSTAMGRAVAPKLAARLARSILELGGNNAAIVSPSADLELALRAVAFSAMGTAGQRCTTLRRLIVHEDVYDDFLDRMKAVWDSVAIGDPRDAGTLVGPLIDRAAFEKMQEALAEAKRDGGLVTGGDRMEVAAHPDAYYARPAIVEMPSQTNLMQRETFAPILFVLKYADFEEALRLHNGVPQGLSSSIFTLNLRQAEQFLAADGSDCGIANVNGGPSGAEIGGAFGGEKETGGGRESGSDVWKSYMRRMTSSINYGTSLPLAQGVRFDV
jgi:aldehyde dehydrogenase (NAD+)